MSLLEQFLAIARNTFQESIRQPVVFVITVAATLFVVLSNAFATFTLSSDQQMFIDIGLSTVFVAGVLGAAFIATNVLTREIENKTVLTVVSKPVPRPIFILGKYIGVAATLIIMLLYLTLVFMVVEVHGSLESAAAKYHMPAIVFGVSGVLLAVAVGVWCNFFYEWAFGATTLCFLTPIAGLVYVLSLVFGREWETQSIGTDFDGQLWIAAGSLTVAVLVLSAIALAASTRLSQLLTLLVTCGFFLLGLLSDWLFGRGPSADELTGAAHLKATALHIAHAIVPNFQVFWLADAVNQGHAVPASYIFVVLGYGALLIGAALAVAIMLFQRREVA